MSTVLSTAPHQQVCQLPPSFRIWRYARPHGTITRPLPTPWMPHMLHGPMRTTHLSMHTTVAAAAAATEPAAQHGDAFLDTSSSHESLGIGSPVAHALRAAGFSHPSRVQVCGAEALVCCAIVVDVLHGALHHMLRNHHRKTCSTGCCMASVVGQDTRYCISCRNRQWQDHCLPCSVAAPSPCTPTSSRIYHIPVYHVLIYHQRRAQHHHHW